MNENRDKCFVRSFRTPGVVSLEERYKYQYPIIMKYLLAKIAGKSIGDGLRTFGEGKIVLYSVTEITKMVCDDLIASNEEKMIKCICDRNANDYKNGYRKYDVISPDSMLELQKKGEVDCIMICNVFREHEIIEDLVSMGIPLQKIVHIVDVIYWL